MYLRSGAYRAFLYKTSSKLKNLKANFEDKASFIIKMSKSELKERASGDENNGIEESELSDDEYLSDFTKLQPYKCKSCVSKVSERKLPRRRIIRFRSRHQ